MADKKIDFEDFDETYVKLITTIEGLEGKNGYYNKIFKSIGYNSEQGTVNEKSMVLQCLLDKKDYEQKLQKIWKKKALRFFNMNYIDDMIECSKTGKIPDFLKTRNLDL